MVDLYQNIKKLADNRKIQYKDIAETLGVSQNTVTNWFKGQNSMKAEFIPVIAKLLRVSIDQLFQEVVTPLKNIDQTPELKLDAAEDGCAMCKVKDAEINKWKDKYIYLLENGVAKKETGDGRAKKLS